MKGYYKRAKAHVAVWNEKEARRDFNMVAQLDVTLASLIRRELKALSERMKEKYWEEKEQYWNMLEKTENRCGEEENGGGDDEGEKENEEKGKAKQEDLESVTSATEAKSGEENNLSPLKCAEVQIEEHKVTPSEGTEEETSCSGINLNTCEKTEGKDWQQMLRLVMLLQNEGNFLIKKNCFQEASVKFKEALEYVDFLQNKVHEICYGRCK